jgi:hypothetical protein
MNPSPQFLDFELQVVRNTVGVLEVQILDSPRDRPAAPFQPPCSASEALELLAELRQRVDRDIEQQPGNGDDAALDLEEVGGGFFASLFPDKLRTTFDSSLARAPEEGLRLRLAFDPKDGELAPFSALPWELLFHPRQRRFLAWLPRVALVRYVDVPVDVERLFVPPPIRVLLVAPEPEDMSSTNVREEQQEVYETLRKLPGVEVRCVQPPTLERTIECLAEDDTHVVHFMGHGGYQKRSGRSGLFFEDRDKQAHCVLSSDLADRLEPFSRSLRLMVVNACLSAADRRRAEQEPFGSVGAALVRAGLMAVVAMQFPISHRAAKRFAGSFYEQLAATGHVEAAAAHARVELHDKEKASSEWITPMVLTRAANGRLFDPRAAPVGDDPLRVGIRSFFGWGVEIEDWSHAFLPLTNFFRGRFPKAGWPEIYERLADFLPRLAVRRQALHLDLVAHQTIAFAAGYLVDVKAGAEVTVRQRSPRGTDDWRLDDFVAADAPRWTVEEHPLDDDAAEVALAISCARPTLGKVEGYVREHLPAVGRIVELRPPDGPGHLSVANGAHAFQLAEAISNEIDRLAETGDRRRFHLFYAGPNGLFFLLGRLSRGPHAIQVYEYDFDDQGTYTPSLSFPPPAPSVPGTG